MAVQLFINLHDLITIVGWHEDRTGPSPQDDGSCRFYRFTGGERCEAMENRLARLPRDDRNGVTIVAGATITPKAFVKGLAD